MAIANKGRNLYHIESTENIKQLQSETISGENKRDGKQKSKSHF